MEIKDNKTSEQYNSVLDMCADVFIKKMHDYGTAWRIMRPSSVTDQIFIKAKRIRTIEEKGSSEVNEGVVPEFIGIANYCIMGLIQLEGYSTDLEDNHELIERKYRDYFHKAKELMLKKNHDYGEAWREMRISSITDLILMKLNRTKQIEENDGKTIISEGIDANYYDMINYAVFALIRLSV